MTMRRRSRSSSRRSSRRRQTLWFNVGTIATAVAIGGQAIVDLLPPGTTPPQIQGGLTVVRMIGELIISSQTADQDGFGAFGITTVTRDAFTAGAVPDPIVDLVDWYYHTLVAVNSSLVGDLSRYTQWDIRTARKIRGLDRTLCAVFDVNAASAQALKFSVNTRLLCAIG